MRQVLALCGKELRGFFGSAVALIFLGAFLAVTLFTFFWVERFFARGLADVRPLFEWLPLLLIFLVAALTMRLWSEEQKLGTLEVLLTLPVSPGRLVLGKFLAGLVLVSLALALTLGVPITVSRLGPLDWGPVAGGYLAALLLACAYLAIGLCVSAVTDSQIVALLFSSLAGLALYLPGAQAITGLVGNGPAELLRAIGTGSRFESVARGVLDARDVVYYAGLVVVFLALNVALLRAKRLGAGPRGRRARAALAVTIALVVGNVVAANLWLAPIAAARVDLTERGEYSVSPVTRRLLRSLDEPLTIRGYFSARTHPLLAPLVPQIRDLLTEYAVASGGRVRVEFVDPRTDPSIEKEAQQEYGIKAVPFQVADRHEAAVVNSYFHILIRHGDQHEVLSFDDLIEVKVAGDRDVEVRLRNLEYDVTRAVKKVVGGFQPLEAVFAALPGEARLTLFVSPRSLPEELAGLPPMIDGVARALAARSGGKLRVETVEPGPDDEARLRALGVQAFSVSLLSQERFYLTIALEVAGRTELLEPDEGSTEGELRDAIEAALRRGAPGFLKTVGLVAPEAGGDPMAAMLGGPAGGRDSTRRLRERLAGDYRVTDVRLDAGPVPGDVDVLVVAGAEGLDERARFAFDQFLMRGGAAIVLAGRYRLELGPDTGIGVAPVTTGLEEVLAGYGVELRDRLVLDVENDPFPIPVLRDLGGYKVEEIQLVPYPFFLAVPEARMASGSPILKGLPGLTLHWSSPLALRAPAGGGELAPALTTEVLLRSSERSWLQAGTEVAPDFLRYPALGFPPPGPDGEVGSHPLAVAVSGAFVSHFRDRDRAPDPGSRPGEDGGDPAAAAARARPGHVLKRSPTTARLVVVGSSSFVVDDVLDLMRETGSDQHLVNLRFVENLVDWAVADEELLAIRARGGAVRALRGEPGARRRWELVNYGLAGGGLLVVWGAGWAARRRRRPLALDPPSEGARRGGQP